jgi:hypothetical protein
MPYQAPEMQSATLVPTGMLVADFRCGTCGTIQELQVDPESVD